ncbi:unnamed protein product [Ambrosiozyma monospora]|uniref:Unnamed protein product n=1 Tax=Ambrosiozyma monospora TaxID=43982 RepID=A0A9W6YRE4_AMBMO|nr:unnamed protein product [Ambrosiozyma monospora]
MSSPNIWVAAADNKINIVKQYIASGNFSANSPDPNGYTPMHAAASYGNIELFRYLVSVGGNVNIQDSDGDTPLHHVETVEAAKALINEFKVNYKVKNNDGYTAGQYQEEEQEFPELAQYLLSVEKNGPEFVLQQDQQKQTAQKEGEMTLPSGEEIKYVMSEDAGDDAMLTDDLRAKRAELEKIFGDSIPEEEKNAKLRQYVLGVVSDNLQSLKDDDDDEAQNSKRRK